MIGVFSCPVAPVPACSWGLGGSCGLRQSASRHVPGLIPFSPGHSSLRPCSLQLARSPQRPQFRPIQIKELRADESSCWIAALATEGNKLSPARSQKRYRAFRSICSNSFCAASLAVVRMLHASHRYSLPTPKCPQLQIRCQVATPRAPPVAYRPAQPTRPPHLLPFGRQAVRAAWRHRRRERHPCL